MDFEHLVISFFLADEKFIVTQVPAKYGRFLSLHGFANRVCISSLINLERDFSTWALEKDGELKLA